MKEGNGSKVVLIATLGTMITGSSVLWMFISWSRDQAILTDASRQQIIQLQVENRDRLEELLGRQILATEREAAAIKQLANAIDRIFPEKVVR